ncbi:MAG: insulinase family protein [Hyphomicrobiaceae bacterium]|nr:insulinase family protein [Hyphomicrobiaceae bacterium]
MQKRVQVSLTALLALVMMLALAQQPLEAQSDRRATQFTLSNGMQVVVVPDHRAPVVTHMVWYRVGAADEPPGVSGIAHFLEHLMFKSTEKIASGEFSRIVSRLGGQDNAFTSQDATAYFQRISKDRLGQLMLMEADRMVNLRLTEAEVLTERDVILEERRSRVENNPQAVLDEQMNAVLYYSHTYGIPVIGWEHEIARLSREDALGFYKRHYAPNNAILVVSGDVTPEEVKRLAEDSYGRLPANGEIRPRTRPMDPEQRAARRVEIKDPRAGKPSVQRYYVTPSYVTAEPGEAEALDLLMKIAGSGATSRLYQKLVSDEKIASSAGGWYGGSSMDFGKIAVYAIPADGVSLATVESAIDAVLADIVKNGVTEAELDRAKKAYLAEYIYESDNQSTLARRYGWALVAGRTVEDIEAWPERISKVKLEDVKKAAARYLDARRSVTGTLLPVAPDGVVHETGASAPLRRS